MSSRRRSRVHERFEKEFIITKQKDISWLVDVVDGHGWHARNSSESSPYLAGAAPPRGPGASPNGSQAICQISAVSHPKSSKTVPKNKVISTQLMVLGRFSRRLKPLTCVRWSCRSKWCLRWRCWAGDPDPTPAKRIQEMLKTLFLGTV